MSDLTQPLNIRRYICGWLIFIFAAWALTTVAALCGIAFKAPSLVYIAILIQLVTVPGLALSKILEFRALWQGREPGNLESVPVFVALIIATVAAYSLTA